MKIAVLGMGGIGGVVGASLAKKFDDIYFIALGEALKVIRENGITLKSDRLGTFTAKPKLATDNVNEIGIVDVLIIATKSYSLASACIQCEPIIGKDTVVLPLLNGVCVSDDIKEAIGDKGQIADGCIYAFSNIVSPGVTAHIGELCHIDIGFKDGRINEKAVELAKMLNEVGIETVFTENVMVPIWEKYILMCGNSCVFSYFECPAGEVHKDPVKSKFIADVYEELVKLAAANGVKVAEDLVERYKVTFSRLPESAITSLYRDIKDGKPNTEFDAVIGKAYKMAVKYGVDAPCITKTYEKYQTP